MKLNKEKFDTFLEVTKVFNEKLSINPILYGSLGLNRVIGEFGVVDDADVLIPDEFINERWDEVEKLMESLGFELKDIKEHEFVRDGDIVAFAEDSDSVKLIGVEGKKLEIIEIDGVRFKEFTPEQYLVMYKHFFEDGYRRKKKGEADQRKIKLIEEYLENR